jgi:hypothetical protein
MDRLKLETDYLRALDMLMSADEYQLQAAILRLDRAQARLHGWGMPGSHDPERRGYLGCPSRSPLGCSSASASSYRISRPMGLAVPADNRAMERRVGITFEELLWMGEH